MTENIPREFKYKRIKYLPLDVERRSYSLNDYTNMSVSMTGLNKSLDTTFTNDVFLLDSNCSKRFEDKTIQKHFLSSANYIASAWKSEWFVEAIFDALQIGRDGNIEIVAHNASHDVKIMEEMFHEHGFPFFWDDKGFKNGKGKEGPFSHDWHDTRAIGQLIRVNEQKLSGGYPKSTQLATAEGLGMKVNKDLLHTSSYDCYLTTRIFIKSQEMFECYYQSKNGLNRAVNNLDYSEIVEQYAPPRKD